MSNAETPSRSVTPNRTDAAPASANPIGSPPGAVNLSPVGLPSHRIPNSPGELGPITGPPGGSPPGGAPRGRQKGTHDPPPRAHARQEPQDRPGIIDPHDRRDRSAGVTGRREEH